MDGDPRPPLYLGCLVSPAPKQTCGQVMPGPHITRKLFNPEHVFKSIAIYIGPREVGTILSNRSLDLANVDKATAVLMKVATDQAIGRYTEIVGTAAAGKVGKANRHCKSQYCSWVSLERSYNRTYPNPSWTCTSAPEQGWSDESIPTFQSAGTG